MTGNRCFCQSYITNKYKRTKATSILTKSCLDFHLGSNMVEFGLSFSDMSCVRQSCTRKQTEGTLGHE